MSLNLVSPGVKVREVDLTIGNITGANEQVGAIAGPFEKGPIDVPLLIENEQDLLATYGQPKESDAQYEYFMCASSYLSYGGVLRVLRSDGDNLNNANAGVGTGSTTLKIKSYDDYIADYQNATTWFYGAKNPGKWGNGLKVCTVDHFADQVLSGVSTTGVTVGMGVTQAITGRHRASAGATSTYAEGFMRGIVTGVGTADISVKVVDFVETSSGLVSATSYEELPFLTATSVDTPVSTGIATVTGILDTDFDITITGITTTNLEVGDVVSAASTVGVSTQISVPTGAKIIAIGATSVTLDQTISKTVVGVASTAFAFTRVTTQTVNTNSIHVITPAGVTTATYTSVNPSDWYNSQTLGLTKGGDISWKTIAEKPGTSEYAASRGGKNDEMHVVVVDEDGSATGIQGNIVEKFTYLSKAKDGKRQPPEEVYYKNYLARVSEFIYAGYSPDGVAGGLSSDTGTAALDDFEATGTDNWGSNASGVTFAVEGAVTRTLAGGKNYSGTDDEGYAVSRGDVLNSYGVLKNPAEYTINFILQGPSGGATIYDSQAKAQELISIATVRKDCIACISPHRNGVVNISNSDTQTDNIIEYYNGLQSSSYAVFDSGYKYAYDRFNNEYRYIPLNGDIGGLMARTSINSFSWFSPAGASRGAINGAVKLAYNPTQAQRDLIYPKRINPVIASPGAGIILFGDRTGLGVASAFDRINVRRLFLTVESTIERAARDQLFEFNDVITRTNFLNIVDPFLRDVKAKRGITDFVVICDETNNTPDVIDANQFRADIFVKPARSINFIGLTFVATRTGVSFEEVVGNV